MHIVIGFGVIAVLLFVAAVFLYKRLLKKVDQWYREGYR